MHEFFTEIVCLHVAVFAPSSNFVGGPVGVVDFQVGLAAFGARLVFSCFHPLVSLRIDLFAVRRGCDRLGLHQRLVDS